MLYLRPAFDRVQSRSQYKLYFMSSGNSGFKSALLTIGLIGAVVYGGDRLYERHHRNDVLAVMKDDAEYIVKDTRSPQKYEYRFAVAQTKEDTVRLIEMEMNFGQMNDTVLQISEYVDGKFNTIMTAPRYELK